MVYGRDDILYIPPSGTRFYRVTDRGQVWPNVLSGAGAYFTYGGRYNRIQQKTVYAADDPLVSITEAAFHQAVDWQTRMGGGRLSAHPPVAAPPLPLVSDHILWCFTLANPPALVDVEDPAAIAAFQHRPHELLNPSQDYHRTAMLADRIRHHPRPAQPIAGGILAPSVRTPADPPYIPRQHIFFLPHNVLTIHGTRVRRWKLTLEFLDVAGQQVTGATRDIDWAHPRFRLGGAHLPVPAFAPRPNSHPFVPGNWYQIEIRFA